MALKKELEKKTKNKSFWVLLCTFPVLLVSAIIGVITLNNSNKNKEEVVEENKYQYDYEYDENWQEILNVAEEQREKYKNIDCECG